MPLGTLPEFTDTGGLLSLISTLSSFDTYPNELKYNREYMQWCVHEQTISGQTENITSYYYLNMEGPGTGMQKKRKKKRDFLLSYIFPLILLLFSIKLQGPVQKFPYHSFLGTSGV